MDTEGTIVTVDGLAYERLRFILAVMDGSSDPYTRTEQDVVHFALIVTQIAMRSPNIRELVSAAYHLLNEETQE